MITRRWATRNIAASNPVPGAVLYVPLWESSLSGDIFPSQDAFGHLCTATNAIFGSTGRTFDGASGNIAVPAATSLNDIWSGGGTLIAWVYASSDGEADQGMIVSKQSNTTGFQLTVREEAAGKVKVRFLIRNGGANLAWWTTTATQITINTWTMVTVLYNGDAAGNDPTIYIDNTALTVGSGLTEGAAPVGTYDSDASDNLYIGNRFTAGAEDDLTFDGIIGLLADYSGKTFTADEIADFKRNTEGIFA